MAGARPGGCRHTFGAIFGLDMLDKPRRGHYRQLVGDMIVAYPTTPAT